uniref:Mucin-5AC-like n=1 Tax=Cynoglossus semilaevis TaxID=244447 RepID=A0A3P8W3L0_CYNSE
MGQCTKPHWTSFFFAAAKSQTTPNQQCVKSNQTSSFELATGTLHSQSKKRSNVSAVSLQSPSPAVAAKVASAPSSRTSTYSLPSPLCQNKKNKVSEHIVRTSTQQLPPSTTVPSLSPSITGSKKKSHLGAKQAATHHQVTPQETTSASGDLYSGSKTTAQTTGTNMISEKNKLTTDSKAKGASKKKTSKTKKAVESRPTKSDCPDSELEKSTKKTCVRDTCWKDITTETKDLTESETTGQARITVQGAKAMLARAKTTPKSSRGSFLNNNENTDNLSIKTHLDSSLGSVATPVENNTDAGKCLHQVQTLSNHLPCTRLQQTDLQLVTNSCMSLIPLQHNSFSQSKQTFPTAPLSSNSIQLSLAANKGIMTEALKSNQTHLLSLSTSAHQISTPPLCPPPSHTVSLRTEWKKAALQDRKPNTAHILTEDAGTQRLLGHVRLRELPEWIACRVPGHPKGVVDMVQKGWHWYCRKYIHVRKGGVGGLGMLLAGYCVLGYIWNYSHTKRDRWRKYH